jgi:hypothetical protein
MSRVYVEFVGFALVGEVDRAVVGRRFPRSSSFLARTAFFQHRNQVTQLTPYRQSFLGFQLE